METGFKVLKDQAFLQADARLVKLGRQAANPDPAMKMGFAPMKTHPFHRQAYSPAGRLGKFPKLREKIRVDLNRQGWPQDPRGTFWQCLLGGLFALWHKVFRKPC